MTPDMIDTAIQEVASVLVARGAPRGVVQALARVLPVLLPWAVDRISEGGDPGADREALMSMAEAQARAFEDAKFGGKK